MSKSPRFEIRVSNQGQIAIFDKLVGAEVLSGKHNKEFVEWVVQILNNNTLEVDE